jgi:quinol monooxygenase YgiN
VRVLIQYKVKPDKLEPNMTMLRAVYEELRAGQPDGLRYATFQLEDGVTFLAYVETEDGAVTAPHHRLRSFHRYRSALEQLCDQPPSVTMLREVGSYRFG